MPDGAVWQTGRRSEGGRGRQHCRGGFPAVVTVGIAVFLLAGTTALVIWSGSRIGIDNSGHMSRIRVSCARDD